MTKHDALIAMLQSGVPYDEIGKALNMTPKNVAYQAVKAGLRRRTPFRRLTLPEMQEIRRRAIAGEHRSQLASEYKVSRATIWRAVTGQTLPYKLGIERNVNKVLRVLRRYPYRNNAYVAAQAGVDVSEVKRVKNLLRDRDRQQCKQDAAPEPVGGTLVDWLEFIELKNEKQSNPTPARQHTKKENKSVILVGNQSKRAIDILLKQYGVA